MTDYLMDSKPLLQPPRSKIVRKKEADGSTVWLMPATKAPNGLLVFGVIWTGMIGFMVFNVLSDMIDGGFNFAVLMLLPFIAVGIGLLFFGLRAMLMESVLVFLPNQIRLIQKVFGRVKLMEFNTVSKTYVEKYEAYKKNDLSVYGIRLFNADGDEIKFGSRLSQCEVLWLLGELRAKLMPSGNGEPLSVSSGYGSAVQLAQAEDLIEYKSKCIEVNKLADGGFYVVSNHQSAWIYLLIGFIFVGIISVFTFPGQLGLEGADDVPVVFAVIFYLSGGGLICLGWSKLGRSDYFEFGDHTLRVHSVKLGRAKGHREYARESFKSCSLHSSGHVNNKPRYRLVLKGDEKTVSLASFVPIDAASAVEQWVQNWLR